MAGSQHTVNTLRLISLLRGRRRGMSTRNLIEELGCGRSSLYRYLATLEAGRVPIRRFKVNGEAWVTLDDVAGNLTNEQLWAIAIARPLLRGLEGTQVVTALDRILATVPDLPVQAQAPAPHDAEAARAVVEAIRRRRRLRVRYRGMRDDDARSRELEPIALHFAAGAWYVMAFDVDGDEPKTFKLARFAEATVLPAAVKTRDVDVEGVYAQSVAVWCGEPVDVVVELTGEGARLAHEYPLHPAQVIDRVNEGTAVVRATVAGLEEVARWVLRWGACARAVAPDGLVARVRAELAEANKNYERAIGSSQPSGTARAHARSRGSGTVNAASE